LAVISLTLVERWKVLSDVVNYYTVQSHSNTQDKYNIVISKCFTKLSSLFLHAYRALYCAPMKRQPTQECTPECRPTWIGTGPAVCIWL